YALRSAKPPRRGKRSSSLSPTSRRERPGVEWAGARGDPPPTLPPAAPIPALSPEAGAREEAPHRSQPILAEDIGVSRLRHVQHPSARRSVAGSGKAVNRRGRRSYAGRSA